MFAKFPRMVMINHMLKNLSLVRKGRRPQEISAPKDEVEDIEGKLMLPIRSRRDKRRLADANI